MFKRIFIIFLILVFSQSFSLAELIIDDSVQDQIESEYNLDALPSLPDNLQNSTPDSIFTPNEFDTKPVSKYVPPSNSNATTANSVKTNAPVSNSVATQKTPTKVAVPTKTSAPVTTPQKNTQTEENYSDENPSTMKEMKVFNNDNGNFEAIKLNKGTKFKVINTQTLSDGLRKGTQITFVTTSVVTKRYITIPINTIFKGVVLDSHRPNLTGNGGLLVIKATQIHYKGANYPINAKITIANQKKVFFNNIKGKRSYWRNIVKSTKFGKKTYDKMWKITKQYFKPSVEVVITPITFVTGIVVYGTNIIISPVLAIFTKGGKLSIPKGSKFEIKLLDDAIIYK